MLLWILVLTHPAIALTAVNETVAVVVSLDERFLALGAALIHGPTIAKSLTDCNMARGAPDAILVRARDIGR